MGANEQSAKPVIERLHTHAGVRAPLWEHAARLRQDPHATAELLKELALPERLDAFQELVFHAHDIRLAESWEVAKYLCAAGFGPDVGTWAASRADALLARWAKGVSACGGVRMLLHIELRLPVFLPLARAGIAIEQRWEPLFPMLLGPYADWMHECLAAVSPARRDPMLVAEFEAELDPASVLEYALELLRSHPSRWLVEQALARAGADYRRSEAEVIQVLVDAVAPHAQLAAWLNEHLPRRASQVVYEVTNELSVAVPAQVPEHVQPVVDAALGAGASFGPQDRVRLVSVKAVGTPRSYLVVLQRDQGIAYRAGTLIEVARLRAGRMEGEDEALALRLHEALAGRL